MKFTVGKKLALGFSIVSIIILIVNIINYFSILQINNSYSELVNESTPLLIELKGMQYEAIQVNNRVRDYLLTGNDSNFTEIDTHFSTMETYFQNILEMTSDEEIRGKVNEIMELNHQNKSTIEQYRKLNRINLESADAVIFPASRTVRDAINEVVDMQTKIVQQESQANESNVKTVVFLTSVISIIAILISIVIAIIMTRLISRPLRKLTEEAKKVAQGDLSNEAINVRNKDEIGELATAFSQMISNLRAIIQKVRSNSEQVAASSEELSASAEQSSQASEHIANSVQEIAAGSDVQVQGVEEAKLNMEELSNKIQHIARNSNDVYTTSVNALNYAKGGNTTVQSTVQQIQSIHQSIHGLSSVVQELGEQSKEIGQIVQVISDIAAQTNLLALNAAIEAARAGEHGRGFAVVADEVRKLAEQSANSSDKISALIQSIQSATYDAVQSMEEATEEVNSGIQLVGSTGKTFHVIQDSVEEVTQKIGEVSEQAAQISTITMQMVQLIQHVAEIAETSSANTQNVSSATEEQLASMEEITASANSLAKMGEELQEIISQFKL